MYICMYVCVCVCMYLCMYLYMYVCMYMCVCVWMYVCMYYVCMYVFMYVYIRTNTWRPVAAVSRLQLPPATKIPLYFTQTSSLKTSIFDILGRNSFCQFQIRTPCIAVVLSLIRYTLRHILTPLVYELIPTPPTQLLRRLRFDFSPARF